MLHSRYQGTVCFALAVIVDTPFLFCTGRIRCVPRIIAVSTQASYIYVCLFHCNNLLQQQSAIIKLNYCFTRNHWCIKRVHLSKGLDWNIGKPIVVQNKVVQVVVHLSCGNITWFESQPGHRLSEGFPWFASFRRGECWRSTGKHIAVSLPPVFQFRGTRSSSRFVRREKLAAINTAKLNNPLNNVRFFYQATF